MKLGFIGGKKIDELPRAARFAADNGFDSLEFDYWGEFADLTDETVGKMKGILDSCGVGVSAMGLWNWNHLSGDADERAASLAQLDRAIEFGQRLEADVLVTGGGDIPDAPLATKVEQFCEVMAPFIDKIEAAGMTPAFYAVHSRSFFDSIEAYQAVWEHIPNAYIKFDPANWDVTGHDYLAIVREHGDKIAHVHIKEHLYHAGDLAAQPPAGMGDIQWGKVLAFLYEHGYDGHLSIEPHGPIWSKGDWREKMCLLTKKHISRFLL